MRNKFKTTHGMSRTRENQVWRDMRNRCLNPKHRSYSYYGGRGITICERWDKFENFIEDMGLRPKGLSLDRIDNSKGYYKENCHWTEWFKQMLNRRSKNKIGFQGVSKRGNSFRAKIIWNYKGYSIGTFPTPELASIAYESCKFVLNSSHANL